MLSDVHVSLLILSTDVPVSLGCDCLQDVEDKVAELAAGFAADCTSHCHRLACGYTVEMVSTIGSE